VTSKAQFVRLYQEGVFGNRAPTWNHVEDIPWCMKTCPADKKFHIRNRVAGGPTHYDLDIIQVFDRWCDLEDEGVNPATLYVSEMAPHHLGTAQGEVQRSVNFIDLTITTGKLPMRQALLTDYTTFVTGLRAEMLLRYFMNARSYEWLEYLFEDFPDHTVEFTCFSKCWGTEPGYNTVFWEVRKY
jgi:hypothetical protein